MIKKRDVTFLAMFMLLERKTCLTKLQEISEKR